SGNLARNNGGGIYNDNSSTTVTNCTFIGNTAETGGGMSNHVNSNTTVTDCTFSGNEANSGGGMYNINCNTAVTNCMFSRNSVEYYGGGMCNNSGSTAVTNCTFNGNEAKYQGGGVHNDNSNLTVTNCILWDNSDQGGIDESAQIYINTNTPVVNYSCNYSCIQDWTGNLGGIGNIGGNPLFVATDGSDDNLRLLAGSPCINAGDPNYIAEPNETDLDGNPRIVDGIIDMGAYEGPHQGFLLSTESLTVPEGLTATFTVALAMEPNGMVEVTVAVESGDPDIIVLSGGTLTFDSSNYSNPQTVRLAAVEDSDYFNGTALVWISAAGFSVREVIATEWDSDAESVMYVDDNAQGANNGTSWADGFTDLQEALSIVRALPQVSELRVAQGQYRPAGPFGDPAAIFGLINGVAIKGGYAGFGAPNPNARDISKYETILSGDLNGDDGPNFTNNYENSYSVVTGSATDATAVLDGFTIVGGNAWGGGGTGTTGTGGTGPPPPPTGTGGTGGTGGTTGGTVPPGESSTPQPSSRGGMFNWEGRPTVSNCTFTGNYAGSGGGMCNEQSEPTVTNCTFSGNKAYLGGGMYNGQSSPTLTNCVFSGNRAIDKGGGMYNIGSSPTVSYCTFSENRAHVIGGGIYNEQSSSPIVTNCILWGNTDFKGQQRSSQIYGENHVVKYCCIQDWPIEPVAGCTIRYPAEGLIAYWKLDGNAIESS
ncbi:MAG: choice-of-anchor Q domain-containing protein, partial [Planctomycetota bacterium]